jgi:GNAT superfamily N-acetyltransferase
MALWTWWVGDALPTLAPLDGFRAEATTDPTELAGFTRLNLREVAERSAAGNRCYVARLDGRAVAYGWVAGGDASIGELDIAFRLTAGDCYLWDFATLPAWRGRGLYPRLLQSILRADGPVGRRYWIINAPENRASAAGIVKAGFRVVGDLAFGPDGRPAFAASQGLDRAQMGAAFLGVPQIDVVAGGVSPCWCCVTYALRQGTLATCWPDAAFARGTCTCGLPQLE